MPKQFKKITEEDVGLTPEEVKILVGGAKFLYGPRDEEPQKKESKPLKGPFLRDVQPKKK